MDRKLEQTNNLNYFDMRAADGDTLFVGLSWEERCYLGAKEDYQRFNRTSRVYVFCNIHSSTDDNQNKFKITKYFKERKVEVITVELDYSDPFKCWTSLERLTLENQAILRRPVVDITTMPREVTWMLFHFIKRIAPNLSCTYHSPEGYSQKWLSKEPGTPRFLLKHSGVSHFNKQTAVILITGFDAVRTKKLVEFYEPKLILLGVQSGKQFGNLTRNSLETHKAAIKGQVDIETFTIDAYAKDFGLSTINAEIKKLKQAYNIIACSQGPKPTSVALYKSHLSHQEVALCYVPSREFNREYSHGIKDTYVFDIKF